jgi:type IV pilus assembly protein PilQ
VGDPRLVAIAETYLRQLDLRQRQVALAVKILDVNLENAQDIANSFAFRWGNNFIVNDNGQLVGAFGRDLPPQADSFRRDIPEDIKVEIDQSGQVSIDAPTGVNASGSFNVTGLSASLLQSIQAETGAILKPVVNPRNGRTSYVAVPQDGTSVAELQAAIQRQLGNASASGYSDGTRRNPGLNYPRDNFYNFVKAQIISRTTKLLASPTLILQENPAQLRQDSEGGGSSSSSSSDTGGLDEYSVDSPIGRRKANEAVVRVGTNVTTDFEVTTSGTSGTVICTPTLSTAGLVLGARIEKIDDNGFVTFSLSPSISAVTDREPSDPNCGGGFINVLSVRRLDTGAVRVRDGQTLILTGVISDFDRAEVSKWPILGDLPLVGQFFRASGNRREKRELVIMVSPRIINDQDGGTFGYGFQSGSSETRQFMSQPGF